ncbi:hypothetical protein NW758_014714 [Fusarium oxysporum]|nr:hypothetical protein NW758_014714 [Fusarium oxysporum]
MQCDGIRYGNKLLRQWTKCLCEKASMLKMSKLRLPVYLANSLETGSAQGVYESIGNAASGD